MGLIIPVWTNIGKTEEMARAATLLISDCAQCAKSDRRKLKGVKELFMVLKTY